VRTCLDCDTGITARSKSGRCQPCSARAFMSERGSALGRRGGVRRAERTTPEQRSEWGRRGARAMWANWRAARVARLEAEIAERMDALAALRR
jgi:DNA-directed RNA polymerase subunit RPC12/RpoP